MKTASSGDTVKVHYTGTLDDGTQFDSSDGREPLEVTLGTGSVIPGFETALIGMSVGDKKSVSIPSDQAYGPHSSDAVRDYPRASIPDDIELFVGQRLQAQGPDGQSVGLSVVEVGDDSVKLDANHPLAGKDLKFDLELVEIA